MLMDEGVVLLDGTTAVSIGSLLAWAVLYACIDVRHRKKAHCYSAPCTALSMC